MADPKDNAKAEKEITNNKKEQITQEEQLLKLGEKMVGLTKQKLEAESKSTAELREEMNLAERRLGLEQDSVKNSELQLELLKKEAAYYPSLLKQQLKELATLKEKVLLGQEISEKDKQRIKDLERETELTAKIADSKTKALSDQIDAQEKLNKLLETTEELTEKIARNIFGVKIGSFKESWLGKILEKKELGMGGFGAELKEVGKGLGRMITSGDALVGVTNKIAESTLKMAFAENEGLAAFNKTTGAAGKYDNVLLDVSRTNKEFGLDLAETSKALMGLRDNWSDFTSLTVDSQKEMTRFTAMLEQVGVSSSDTGKSFSLMTKTLGYSQQQAKRATLEVMKTAQGLGVSVGKMAADFAENMPRLIVHGDKATQKFRELAAASKATGIAIGGLVDMAEKFDTFEGAADIVGQLNSVLGGNLLDSIKMVQETDPVKRLEMLQGALKGAGKDFKQLGYYMQKSLASTLTGGDVEKLGRIMSSDMGKYAEESKKAAVSQKELAEAVHKSQGVMHSFHMLVNGFAVGLQPVIALLKGLIDGINAADDWLKKILGTQVPWIASILFGGTALAMLAAKIKTTGIVLGVFKGSMAATAVAQGAVGATGPVAAGGIQFVSAAAKKAALSMVAFGAAVLMVGAGIGLATLGIAQLAKALQGLSGGAIVGLVVIIGILVIGIGLLATVMTASLFPFLAFGGAMLMIGGALFLIGAAVALVVWRFEKLAEAKGRAASAMTEMFKASSAAGESFPRVTSAVEDLGDALSSLGTSGMIAVLLLTGFFASLSFITSAVANNIKAIASSITEMVSAIQGLDIVKAFVVRAVIQSGTVPATGAIAGGTASPATAAGGGSGGGAVELRSRSDNATATAGSGNSFNQLNISLNLNGRVLDQYIMDVVTKKMHPAAGGNR